MGFGISHLWEVEAGLTLWVPGVEMFAAVFPLRKRPCEFTTTLPGTHEFLSLFLHR